MEGYFWPRPVHRRQSAGRTLRRAPTPPIDQKSSERPRLFRKRSVRTILRFDLGDGRELLKLAIANFFI
jgi:hypothetical protein